jgi:hypothetical protein
MKLEKLDLEGVNKFFEELNSKTTFVKGTFYAMAKRENERNELENAIRERYSRQNDVSDVTIVSEDIAILKFGYAEKQIYYMAYVDGDLVRETSTYTFDEALLLAVLKKYYKNVGAFSFIAKALGMRIGENF